MKPFTVLAWGPAAGRAVAGVAGLDVWLCSSAEEVREQLRGHRAWSAVLLDASMPETDRDLVSACTRADAETIVIDDLGRAEWTAMGAVVVASAAEATTRTVISRSPKMTADSGGPEGGGAEGGVVAVTGPGGTGASTTAIAIAQGLAPDRRPVVLVDLVRNAEQHVLHGLKADVPGIADLVEAHRGREPGPEALRAVASPVPGRDYSVIAGLRRAVAWSALPPVAVEATLRNLRSAFGATVLDVDADLEGEADTGSPDIEERNALARQAFTIADVAVAVVRPGLKGTHAALRVLTNLWGFGLDPQRTVAAVVGGRPEDVSALESGFSRLGAPACRAMPLPDLQLEPLLIHGLPLPETLVGTLRGATLPRLSLRRTGPPSDPVPVRPGSLGLAGEPPESRD